MPCFKDNIGSSSRIARYSDVQRSAYGIGCVRWMGQPKAKKRVLPFKLAYRAKCRVSGVVLTYYSAVGNHTLQLVAWEAPESSTENCLWLLRT